MLNLSLFMSSRCPYMERNVSDQSVWKWSSSKGPESLVVDTTHDQANTVITTDLIVEVSPYSETIRLSHCEYRITLRCSSIIDFYDVNAIQFTHTLSCELAGVLYKSLCYILYVWMPAHAPIHVGASNRIFNISLRFLIAT